MAIKPETIGLRLRQARKDKGLSQNELGALVGVSGTAIMRYEKGEREPKIEQLQKIAGALELPFAYLLGTTDDPSADSFTSAAIEWAFQENSQEKDIDLDKIASRANELRRQNKEKHRVILSQEEVDKQIFAAEQEHKDYLEMLCFDPTMPDEDYPARIRYVTSFIEKNADTLKLAMPGTHMLPDDIEEAKKIRAAGGTPDSSK